MSRLGSERRPQDAPYRRWVIVGNPNGRRVTLFQETLVAGGRPPATVVPWSDLLTGRVSLESVLRPNDLVRIESPGRDFEVEKLLLIRGATEPDEEGASAYSCLPADECARLKFQRGEILYPRQWYRGFRSILTLLSQQLGAGTETALHPILLNDPGEITLLFDKLACQLHLEAAGAPIPQQLGLVRGYTDLTGKMAAAGLNRVFVKFAHGSSASGVIAYRRDVQVRRHQAFTTVEVEESLPPRLFNSRQVRCLTDPTEIARLVDALCRHRAMAEEWLPKANLPGAGAFDVRALSIAGRMRHVIARCSRTPMTNLHLLNDRASGDRVRALVGETAWADLGRSAQQAARAAFPGSLHIGFDVMWLPGFQRLAFLEANAFGDLLNGILHESESTYEAEVRAVEEESWHPASNFLFRSSNGTTSIPAC